jgi:TM2 domain-containing membrane protein YozV
MKNKNTATILAFLLGLVGGHRFYLGQKLWGIIYFLSLGLFGLFIIDGILWLLGSQEDFDKKYNSQAIQREQSQTQRDMLNELKKANEKG